MQQTVAGSYTVTTLLGSQNGLSAILPVTYELRRDCTLNHLLNIFPNEEVTSIPKLRYFGIGIQGCYNANDDMLVSAYNPDKVNMNLYRPIPFRCRPVDDDLTDTERKNYRLRQRKVLSDGNEYFLYYLKLLEISDSVKFKRVFSDGREEPYELNPENLNPIPQKPSSGTTITSVSSTIVSYCEVTLEIDASEVLEYIRVAFNGDTRYARISELGFFTGVEKNVSGTTGQNVPITYDESIYTMLYNHHTWTGTPLVQDGSSIRSKFMICSDGSVIG